VASGFILDEAGSHILTENGVDAIVQEDYTSGAAVTGTVAFTEGDDTIAVAATFGPTATIAITEADDTAAVTATFGPTGTIAFTEADDTATVAASFGPTATITFTEGDDTASLAGAVQVTATVAFTEDDDTIAATGTGGIVIEEAGTHTGQRNKPRLFPPVKRKPIIQLLEPQFDLPPAPVHTEAKWTEADDTAFAQFTHTDYQTQDMELLVLLGVV